MERARKNVSLAFTLIEVLVVVAIIALLVSILIPSLTRARDQAKRVLCAANLHQMMYGIHSYTNDHKGDAPFRGWFTYTVSESYHEGLGWPRPGNAPYPKTLVNLGLLYKKWIGNNHNVLYCPANNARRDDTGSGWPSRWQQPPDWTYGGYNYAAVVGNRSETNGPYSPSYRGQNAFPPNVWSGGFKDWTTNTAPTGWHAVTGQPMSVQFKMPANPCLVSDWCIGGGAALEHVTGVHVAFTDGHVRFNFLTKEDRTLLLQPITSGNPLQYTWWFKFSLKQ